MTALGMVDKLFSRCIEALGKLHFTINEGKIVDASFIKVPIQRNTREENKDIKGGNIPSSDGNLIIPSLQYQPSLRRQWPSARLPSTTFPN